MRYSTIVIGGEYEFYAEMQQDYVFPATERMRNYTSQKVTVLSGPAEKEDPEYSNLYRVRAADGREFEAFEEELNGFHKEHGAYFWPDGTFGPDHATTYLSNERKG